MCWKEHFFLEYKNTEQNSKFNFLNIKYFCVCWKFLFLNREKNISVCCFNASQLLSACYAAESLLHNPAASHLLKSTSSAGQHEMFLAEDGERETPFMDSVNFLCFGGLSVGSPWNWVNCPVKVSFVSQLQPSCHSTGIPMCFCVRQSPVPCGQRCSFYYRYNPFILLEVLYQGLGLNLCIWFVCEASLNFAHVLLILTPDCGFCCAT